MKENHYFMNYPDHSLPVRFESFKLEVLETGFQRLSRFWQGTTFQSNSWRLYYNDTVGGSILMGEKWINLTPDNIYLLAPGCEFKTSIKNNPHQFYLHFHISHQSRRLINPLFILSLDDKSQTLMHDAIGNRKTDFLTCASLIIHTLSRIPSEVFTEKRMDHRISESIRYMRNSLKKEIGIHQLALDQGLSEGAYSRLFRQETNQSPYAFLIALRIESASILLRTTDRSIEEIGEMCGFKERFHFSRTFKRQTNHSPGEFRKL